MSEVRSGHTATLLQDGRVLIVGGADDATAELYDPATGKFSPTGSMAAARSGFTTTLLKNGQVLVVGGNDSSAAELYDPATGHFTLTGSLATNRADHAATLLADGRVLISGGADDSGLLASAELYDPSTGKFSATGSMLDDRSGHSAILLRDGRVLTVGGQGDCGAMPSGTICIPGPPASAEIFDPRTGAFKRTGSMLRDQGETGVWSAAAMLSDGHVLITGGGLDGGRILATAELFDPLSDGFSPAVAMKTPRSNHTMTLLRDGTVLIAGGESETATLSSAEIYRQ
jgi:WD40 repeat protein